MHRSAASRHLPISIFAVEKKGASEALVADTFGMIRLTVINNFVNPASLKSFMNGPLNTVWGLLPG